MESTVHTQVRGEGSKDALLTNVPQPFAVFTTGRRVYTAAEEPANRSGTMTPQRLLQNKARRGQSRSLTLKESHVITAPK